MLTGDNQATATGLASEAGINEVHANLRPEDKACLIRELEYRGPVAMIGDGINDAPALALATIGIAMGTIYNDNGSRRVGSGCYLAKEASTRRG